MYPSDVVTTEDASRGPLTAADLDEMLRRLRDDGFAAAGDAELITAIDQLETMKSVVAAGQARLTARFSRSREAELARFASNDKRDRARRDIGTQIGLARRSGPRLGSRQVGLAKILDGEMPHLMNAFSRGLLDEYQATEVAAETMTLSLEHRRQVDAELATKYGTLTAKQARAQAAAIGYRLDPEQAVRRMRRAYHERRVTLRTASDSMAYLTALVPMVDGVSVMKALNQHAATATALGVPGGRGALMTDELLARLTQPSRTTVTADNRATASGTDTAAASETAGDVKKVEYLTDGLPGVPAGVHIEIQLVMTDRTLLDGDMEPAIIPGHGPIPAPLARHLIAGADPTTKTWVRRLYTDPMGRLTGSDSRRRLFSHTHRQFLVARDQVCRTPWCGAPIRHADHVQAYSSGGPTTLSNGAGLCEACNQTKEHPGWRSETADNGGILITTPTGHTYVSRPPDPPRSEPWETKVA